MARKKKVEEVSVEEVKIEFEPVSEPEVVEVPVEETSTIEETPTVEEVSESVSGVEEAPVEEIPVVEEKPKKKKAAKKSVESKQLDTNVVEEASKTPVEQSSEYRFFNDVSIYYTKSTVGVFAKNFIGTLEVVEEDDQWVTISIYSRSSNSFTTAYVKK